MVVTDGPFLCTIRSIAAPRWRWYGCSMGVEVSVIAAFLAGVLSISSPCVLPLVPIFLAHLAGASAGGIEGIGRRRVLPNAVAYVLGFSLVFVALRSEERRVGKECGWRRLRCHDEEVWDDVQA